MNYISVGEFAKKWNIPERTVRYNCSSGKIIGCFLTGKTWNIPEDAVFPLKSKSEISGFVVPFIIEEDLKLHYYRGLKELENAKEYLTDTCLSAQDNYKKLLTYFEIEFVRS